MESCQSQSQPSAVASRAAAPSPAAPSPAAVAAAKRDLRKKVGDAQGARIDRGVDQAARLWNCGIDGSDADFTAFCVEEFRAKGPELDALFDRLEFAFERLNGYFNSMRRDLKRGADLEIGPKLPIDERLAALDPGAHLAEDLYASRVAFVVLLNFPVTTLAERLESGMAWSRRDWAEARITRPFETRVPAEVQQKVAAATAAAEAYIAEYNIYMGMLLADGGRRLFPADLRLITHWGLRDELKGRYSDPDGLAKQRMIQLVMERIVRQEIPQSVINNPKVSWDPKRNEVQGGEAAREPDTRYAVWKALFEAHALEDPYDSECPSHISRLFDREREIPEAQVRALFASVLDSPLGARVAKLIEKRLGRPLEPFDIWYAGFRPLAQHSEKDLDDATRKKYPTAEAYAADIPRLLQTLGFTEEKARFLANHIVVEPSRGAGHAFGAQRRDDEAHLRTRVGEKGMDYKGYNIAIHEMGHNVEQVFSQTSIDHTLLGGVPNTAFTEALAFVFQAKDLECLGLGLAGEAGVANDAKALEDFWAMREIAGVALVDMDSWHWLYEHPKASAAEFREAVVSIAEKAWNRWYAPLLGGKNVPILAIYSHMVDAALYTPDYPLGHLIEFQVEDYFRWKGGAMGPEFERIAKLGSITPDAWMRQAVGQPLSAAPLLKAAEKALAVLGG
jgi:hypothetical protein